VCSSSSATIGSAARRSAALLASLLAAVLIAPPLAAQQPASAAPARLSHAPSCFDSIPAAAMRRIPVYATAEPVDSTDVQPLALASVDVFTQAVAEAARTLLGASAAQLPPGEPTVSWRELGHRVAVVAHRDGRLAWRVQPPAWAGTQSAGDAGAQLIARAMDAARARGDAFLWTDELRGDSLAWTLRLEPALLGMDGSVSPPALRAGFPVFTVLSPATEPADVERIRTNFPMLRIRGFAGTVRMQFVVDTNGRAIPSTIRGVWPPTERRLLGPPAFARDSIVRAMRGTLEEARFVPARMGGCVVGQLVQQAFTYRPSR
jgi:hypothetical protein